jgi:KipI family sensor histidine kinase inhibitor
VEWPEKVDTDILEDILQFIQYLRATHLQDKDWEMVPAYHSLTLIHYGSNIRFEEFKEQLQQWYSQRTSSPKAERFLWKLPVCYDGEFGIDLPEVSEKLGKSIPEIVSLHTGHVYTVYGIGFLPGFMYLGGLPESLEVPRKQQPRLKVAKGAVGLAGKQTGVYPQESPGGWNIIGNCPVPIFNKDSKDPCFVKVGDKIQFYPIKRSEYDLFTIQGEVGIYQLKKTRLDA